MEIKKLNYINTDPINGTSGCLVYYMNNEAFEKFKKMTGKEIMKEFDYYSSYDCYEASKINDGYIVFIYGEDKYDDEDYDDEDEDDYDDEDED